MYPLSTDAKFLLVLEKRLVNPVGPTNSNTPLSTTLWVRYPVFKIKTTNREYTKSKKYFWFKNVYKALPNLDNFISTKIFGTNS